MKHFIVSVSLAFFWLAGHSQEHKYSVPVLMDIDFPGVKYLYDTPGGRVVRELRHNAREEDFVVFTILDKNDSMFYVSADYCIKGHIGKGWIKKDDTVGIYSRAYNKPLVLFKSPDPGSGAECVMEEYHPGVFVVTDCAGRWLKVRVRCNGKDYQGWMAPDMQCANPYSTCS